MTISEALAVLPLTSSTRADSWRGCRSSSAPCAARADPAWSRPPCRPAESRRPRSPPRRPDRRRCRADRRRATARRASAARRPPAHLLSCPLREGGQRHVATLTPWSVTRRELVSGREILLRVSVRSTRPETPLRRSCNRTCVPAGPTMRAMTASTDLPAVEAPLTVTIASPGTMPARAAGDPRTPGSRPAGRPVSDGGADPRVGVAQLLAERLGFGLREVDRVGVVQRAPATLRRPPGRPWRCRPGGSSRAGGPEGPAGTGPSDRARPRSSRCGRAGWQGRNPPQRRARQ